jgi:hypothetical protein
VAEGGSRRLVVDRIEGEFVVVELPAGGTIDLPAWLLPAGVREGDVLRATATGEDRTERRITFRIDAEATRAAREEVAATLERLRRRDPGGDIAL